MELFLNNETERLQADEMWYKYVDDLEIVC